MTRCEIEWTDDFLIGIAELDYEHKSLVEDINRLQRELLRHHDRAGIEETLGEIDARMQAHFALEEHYMRSHAYPHYREHKAEHDALLDQFTASMVGYGTEPGAGHGRAVEEMLSRWIVDHILHSDKKMSLLVKE